MLEKKEQKQIQKISKEFFEKFCPDEKVGKMEVKDNTVCFSLDSKTPEFLIGKQGRTLISIQHILGRILRKKVSEDIFVDLDVNEYKKKKIAYLEDLARTTADQVSIRKRKQELFPMSSFERRIVHLALSERADVKTEAIGEEPDRRVVITLATY